MHQLTIVVGRRTHDLKIRTWQANIVVSFCAIVYATRHAVSRRSSALTAVSECVGSALDCNRSSSVHLKAMTSRANARVVSVIAMIERMAGWCGYISWRTICLRDSAAHLGTYNKVKTDWNSVLAPKTTIWTVSASFVFGQILIYVIWWRFGFRRSAKSSHCSNAMSRQFRISSYASSKNLIHL